jgi:hypothetical protein
MKNFRIENTPVEIRTINLRNKNKKLYTLRQLVRFENVSNCANFFICSKSVQPVALYLRNCSLYICATVWCISLHCICATAFFIFTQFFALDLWNRPHYICATVWCISVQHVALYLRNSLLYICPTACSTFAQLAGLYLSNRLHIFACSRHICVTSRKKFQGLIHSLD